MNDRDCDHLPSILAFSINSHILSQSACIFRVALFNIKSLKACERL